MSARPSKHDLEIIYNEISAQTYQGRNGETITTKDILDDMPSCTGPGAGFWSTRGLDSGFRQTGYMATDTSTKARFPFTETVYFRFKDGGIGRLDISAPNKDPKASLAVSIHGVGGDGMAAYNQRVLEPFHLADYNCFAITLRGCGDLPMTSPTVHHGGVVNDVGAIIAYIQQRWPHADHMVGLGCSLGAGIMANLCALTGDDCPFKACFFTSGVWDYNKSALAVSKGSLGTRLINRAMGMTYKKWTKKHSAAILNFDADPMPPLVHSSTFSSTSTSASTSSDSVDSAPSSPSTIGSELEVDSPTSESFLSTPATSLPATPERSLPNSGTSSLCEFPFEVSDVSTPVTPSTSPSQPNLDLTCERQRQLIRDGVRYVKNKFCPTFTDLCGVLIAATAGFSTPEEFRAQTSAAPRFRQITRPLVVLINAKNDPLLPDGILPREEVRNSTNVVMIATPGGGHLGFHGHGNRGKPLGGRFYTDVIKDFIVAIRKLAPRPFQDIVTLSNGTSYPQGFPDMAFQVISADEVRRLSY